MPEVRDLGYGYGMLFREAAKVHWALGTGHWARCLKPKGLEEMADWWGNSIQIYDMTDSHLERRQGATQHGLKCPLNGEDSL